MTRTYKDRHDFDAMAPHAKAAWTRAQQDPTFALLLGFHVDEASVSEPVDQLSQHARNVLDRSA